MIPGRIPASTTRRRTTSASTPGQSSSTTREHHDLHGRQLRAAGASPGRLLHRRRRPELVHHRRRHRTRARIASTPVSAAFRISSRMRRFSIKSTIAYKSHAESRIEDDGLGRPARSGGPVVLVGQPRRKCAAQLEPPFSSFILEDRNRTGNFTMTKVTASHTIKAGYQYANLVQTRGTGASPAASISTMTRPTRSTRRSVSRTRCSACFRSYSQVSRWGEGAHTGINHEFFLQDNWKVNQKLTLDYGMRFVHEVPTYDGYFISRTSSPRSARRPARRGCTPMAATPASIRAPARLAAPWIRRQAHSSELRRRPASIVGTLVPGTGITTNGAPTNGLIPAGTSGFRRPVILSVNVLCAAIRHCLHRQPNFRGPWRSGSVYRPAVRVAAPIRSSTIRRSHKCHGAIRLLQDIATAGLATTSPPSLSVFTYDNKLPISIQWNGGVQTKLPFSSTLDVTYTGQHSYNEQHIAEYQHDRLRDCLSDVVAGSIADGQRRPRPPSSTRIPTPSVRTWDTAASVRTSRSGWHTYHSIQLAFSRRLRSGISFGFNDTISLYDVSSVNPTPAAQPDGTLSIRSDQDAGAGTSGRQPPAVARHARQRDLGSAEHDQSDGSYESDWPTW